MLALPWMGLFALAAFWVNVLLIAMAAWKSAQALRLRSLDLFAGSPRGEVARPDLLRVGKVEHGNGDAGVFARRRAEQVGRALTIKGPQRILFVDAKDTHEVFGGSVRVNDIVEDIMVKPDAVYWGAASRCVRVETDFDAAWTEASTSRGVRSTCVDALRKGEDVWLLVDASGRASLVASMDPRAEIARGLRTLGLLVFLTVLGASIVTALMFVPPVFGPTSTVGGVLALAFFLAIQPIAVELQDRARLPNERLVGGLWTRP